MKHFVQIFFVMLTLLGSIHRSFAPITAGSVTVTILPASAVSAGAKWQLDGGTVYDSGVTNQLPTGNHTITFTPVYGWATPANELVTVNSGSTAVTNGIYLLTNSPMLAIQKISSSSTKISWPSAWTNWSLVQNSNLVPANWVTNSSATADDGTNKSVIITNPSGGNGFFRLKL